MPGTGLLGKLNMQTGIISTEPLRGRGRIFSSSSSKERAGDPGVLKYMWLVDKEMTGEGKQWPE